MPMGLVLNHVCFAGQETRNTGSRQPRKPPNDDRGQGQGEYRTPHPAAQSDVQTSGAHLQPSGSRPPDKAHDRQRPSHATPRAYPQAADSQPLPSQPLPMRQAGAGQGPPRKPNQRPRDREASESGPYNSAANSAPAHGTGAAPRPVPRGRGDIKARGAPSIPGEPGQKETAGGGGESRSRRPRNDNSEGMQVYRPPKARAAQGEGK
jgi:hypothetical protein